MSYYTAITFCNATITANYAIKVFALVALFAIFVDYAKAGLGRP